MANKKQHSGERIEFWSTASVFTIFQHWERNQFPILNPDNKTLICSLVFPAEGSRHQCAPDVFDSLKCGQWFRGLLTSTGWCENHTAESKNLFLGVEVWHSSRSEKETQDIRFGSSIFFRSSYCDCVLTWYVWVCGWFTVVLAVSLSERCSCVVHCRYKNRVREMQRAADESSWIQMIWTNLM